MQLRVAVMGGGSWGTTIASMVSRNTPTVLWARDAATVGEINEQHTNQRYLPDARLSARLTATADLAEAVREADVIVMGVPSQTFRATATDVARYIRPWVPVISLAKGLEAGTQVAHDADHRGSAPRASARGTDRAESGARDHGGRRGGERARDGRRHHRAASEELFRSGLFRVYTNTDVIGCELGGVLKNVDRDRRGHGRRARRRRQHRAPPSSRAAWPNSRGSAPRSAASPKRLPGSPAWAISSRPARARTAAIVSSASSSVKVCASTKSSPKMHMVAEGVKSVPAVIALAERTASRCRSRARCTASCTKAAHRGKPSED